jgi:putative addiction module component (TIGR02574 family)
MTRTLTRDEISELAVSERLELLERIWDSLPSSEIPVPESHKRALDAALDDLERNPEAGETWESVKRDLSRGR